MDKLRIGVIGYGYWGPNLVRNFVEIPGAEMIAVSDLRIERLAQAKSIYPSLQTTTNYFDLFDMDLDAVVVATPPTTHHNIARDCLEHGLNVLVEKPLTLTSDDALALCNQAKASSLTLMVGHTFEYNAAVHALRKLMSDGDIGEVHYIDTARLNLGLFQRGLNVLWDLAPHDISILLHLLQQPPVSVSAHGMACVFKDIHDVAYITLLFPNDVLAHVHVSWLDPCKVRRVTVVGSKKMVVYNDIEAQEKLRIYDKGVDGPGLSESQDDFRCSYRYGDIIIPNIKLGEPLRAECQHFVDCIQKKEKPCTCGMEGYQVVRILEAAQRSMSNSGHQEILEW